MFSLTSQKHLTSLAGEDYSIYWRKLDAVDSFTYIGSTIDSNLSQDAEINTRIAKAAAVMSKLNRRVWQNNNLTQMTKLCVYQACVLSTLL